MGFWFFFFLNYQTRPTKSQRAASQAPWHPCRQQEWVERARGVRADRNRRFLFTTAERTQKRNVICTHAGVRRIGSVGVRHWSTSGRCWRTINFRRSCRAPTVRGPKTRTATAAPVFVDRYALFRRAYRRAFFTLNSERDVSRPFFRRVLIKTFFTFPPAARPRPAPRRNCPVTLRIHSPSPTPTRATFRD